MSQSTKQTRREEREEAAAAKAKATRPDGAKLKEEMDALIDEIDTVLEDACCATEYRQKGGQ